MSGASETSFVMQHTSVVIVRRQSCSSSLASGLRHKGPATICNQTETRVSRVGRNVNKCRQRMSGLVGEFTPPIGFFVTRSMR